MPETCESAGLTDQSESDRCEQRSKGDDVVPPPTPKEKAYRGGKNREDQRLVGGFDGSVLAGVPADENGFVADPVSGHRIRIVIRRQKTRRIHFENYRRR